MNNLYAEPVISVHYSYVKLFIEKTDDFKHGMSCALVWSHIMQSAWEEGKFPEVVTVNIQPIKDIFGVTNQFIDAMFDLIKLNGLLSSYEKNGTSTVLFSLANEDKVSMEASPIKIKKRPSVQYSDEFLNMWKVYPKRNVSSAKKPAFAAWKSRIEDGVTAERLLKAVKNYYNECVDQDNIGTSFVLMPQTFFGINGRYEPYLEDEGASENIAENFIKNKSSLISVGNKAMSGFSTANNVSVEEKKKIFLEALKNKR